MSIWLNNKVILTKNLMRKKPCHELGYCPYGCLVEEFPLEEVEGKKDSVSCKVFGHNCPMFYHAEDLSEFGKKRIKEKKE